MTDDEKEFLRQRIAEVRLLGKFATESWMASAYFRGKPWHMLSAKGHADLLADELEMMLHPIPPMRNTSGLFPKN